MLPLRYKDFTYMHSASSILYPASCILYLVSLILHLFLIPSLLFQFVDNYQVN